MGWLSAIGFQERAVYRDEKDPSTIVHAELVWPKGGGLMLGSFAEQPDWPKQPGTGATYLVCDDCDEVFRRAVAAGATVLREPADQDYGGRSASVQDVEGNLWSMGTYAGE
nr:VOC family protein [Ornithinimicrobium sp. F0845]